jgi:hypothetical protein
MASEKKLQDRVGKLMVLQGPEWQTPPPSKALSLLRRLANDPGIVGIMKKHDWRIGLLEEMPPEGLVGISAVCILGINTGRGMKVSLRLRTDDKQGFRNYHTIRSTLLHELAHNDISEHDQSFWQLVSKLNKEVIELDWTKSSGRTTGRQRRQVYSDRLNPSERGDESSSEDEPLLDDPDPEGYLLGGYTAGKSRLLHLNTGTPAQKPTLGARSAIDDQNQKLVPVAASIVSAPSSSTDTDSRMQVDPPKKKIRTYWRCPDCTYRNELSAQNCLSCNALTPLLRTESLEIKEEAAKEIGVDVTDIHDPVIERNKKLEKFLTLLIQSTDLASATTALDTLERILGNLLLTPHEEKFKAVYPSNKAFFTRVGRHLAALDFLREIGFADEASSDRLVYKRNDPGLLWMAKSAVRSKLDAFNAIIQAEEEPTSTNP